MTNKRFDSVLWLDDMRTPLLLGVDVVRNYEQFVAYIERLEPEQFPELISFDHDLSLEHYPFTEADHSGGIPYATYKEKTGLECARYLIENNLPVRYWTVHSFNPVGRRNIERELKDYRPQGWIPRADIPYTTDQQIDGVNDNGYRVTERRSHRAAHPKDWLK